MKSLFLFVAVSAILATNAPAANWAFDSAADNSYTNAYPFAWTSGMNGGYGFTPWTLVQGTQPCYVDAYFFVEPSTNSCNHGAPGINTPPFNGKAWGMSTDSNNNACVTNELPTAIAYRGFTGGSLGVGQTFEIYVQNGSVDGGVGVEFRTGDDTTAKNSGERLHVYLPAGANWQIWDNSSTSNSVDTGMAWDTDGFKVVMTLKSIDTYSLTITNLNPAASPTSVTVTGTLSGVAGSGIDSVALWTSSPDTINGCQNVYWNSMKVSGGPTIANLAYDDAADVAYTNAWPNAWHTGLNGGHGFGPWTTTEQPCTNLQWNYFYVENSANGCNHSPPGINAPPAAGTNGVSWGMSSETFDCFSGFPTNNPRAVAYRNFTGGPLGVGQTFEIYCQFGSVDGPLGIEFRTGNDTTAKNSGERLHVYLPPGADWQIWDKSSVSNSTDAGICWNTYGFKIDLTLTGVDTYSLTLTDLSPTGPQSWCPAYGQSSVTVTGALTGIVGTGINSVALWTESPVSSCWQNLYWNRMSITGNGDVHITGIKLLQGTNAVISFTSLLSAVHYLQRAPDLSGANWSTVVTNVMGNGGIMDITNSLPGPTQKQFYRIGHP
ncbi:MAG TPA: hypothetical protein VL486_13600 [Verrucomicrobiae bacterium]|nr:hypothetical protein [Verrucomicrobiae bacterium]